MKPINIKSTMSFFGDWVKASKREHENWKYYRDADRTAKDEEQTAERYYLMLSDKGYLSLASKLAEVQERAKARLISAERILLTLTDVEETLGIPKKAMNGISVTIDDNAQRFPNAYKGIPESTQFTAEYKNGWRVTDICRAPTRSPSRRVTVEHTDESRAALINRFTAWE